MARDILAIPATSVLVERRFSSLADIVTLTLTSMPPLLTTEGGRFRSRRAGHHLG